MSCFPMFYAYFSSRLTIRVTCSHVCMMLFTTLFLDLCVYVLFAMSHAQIYICICLYAWIHVLPYLCAKFLHIYMYVSMPICLDLCSHVSMCLDLCSLHTLCYIFHVLVHSMPCLCAQTQAMFVMPCAIVAFLLLCLSLLCFGLMVGTRSRPYGLCHRPYTLAHIKGFGSPLFACLCLLTSMLYAYVSLSISRLCHA